MAIEILCYQNRTRVYSGGPLTKTDGTPLVLQAADKLRLKIGSLAVSQGVEQAPALDLVSGIATTNGSVLMITNLGSANGPGATFSMELVSADTALLTVGPNDLEVMVVDSTDSNRTKEAGIPGVIHVVQTMAGSIG